MVAPLSDTAKVHVPTPLADALLHAAESLPEYDNREFYSTDLQSLVHDRVRQGSPSGFDWLVGEIHSRLVRRPYCALVQGIRYDEGNRLFVGINRAFGELVARPYEKPRAQLVHYIQPATDLPAAQGSQFESEKLHTDTADWNPPVKLISMLCVRADREGGGRSRVLDIESLRQEVNARLGSRTLEFLATEPAPWPVAPYRGGGYLAHGALGIQHVLAAVFDRHGRGFAWDRIVADHDRRPGFPGTDRDGHTRNAGLSDARRGIVVRRQPQDAARAHAPGKPDGF